jgi:hypothetical protein
LDIEIWNYTHIIQCVQLFTTVETYRNSICVIKYCSGWRVITADETGTEAQESDVASTPLGRKEE